MPRAPHAKRDLIDELLLADLYSLTEIAERVGVSRMTVHNRRAALLAAGRFEELAVVGPGETLLGRPIRCQGECAGLIHVVPCRACRALRLLASERAARQLGLIGFRDADSPAGKKQREMFGDEGPRLPRATKKPPAISTRFSGIIPHFRGPRPGE